MGLADVQLVRYALALAAAVKVADTVLRGEPLWLAGLWAGAAIAAAAHRSGLFAVAVVAFGSSGWFDPSNHTTLIGAVSLGAAVFTGRDLRKALTVLASTVYLFASINKLIGGTFLTGAPIVRESVWLDQLPGQVLVVMAAAVVGTQLWLAWAVWRSAPAASPVALLLHVGIVVGVSSFPAQWIRLTMFNGLMVLLVWLSTRPVQAGYRPGFEVGPERGDELQVL